METHYHTIVIGSGQGGGPLATTLARAGHRTALVERAHIGGTCVNEGCTPTKTMVASARVAHLTRRGADYGVRSGGVTVDMVRVRERKRVIVESFRGGSERQTYATENLDVIWGDASFSGPRELRVALNDGGTATITADQIVISTGGRPAPLGVPGADSVPALDSTSIMELDSVPEHLVVVGGGYIALEFGQMFRRFGSHVTIIQRGAQLLPREDEDIAQAMAGILHQDGIEVLLGSSPSRVERLASGVRVAVRSASGGERTVDGSHLLVAAGRLPNTDTLNLAAAGVETDRHGFITVDGRLATSAPGVYAIGDAKGGPAFTHIAYDDFRILRANMLHGGDATADGRMVPYTVFTDPQLGRVGLTEREAREQGRRVKVASMPMSSVARALETDETRGLMKALVDADSGQILGCAILGVEGGEIMSMIQLAMMGGLPYTALRDATFAHPTFAESLNNLFTTIEE